MSSCKSCLIFIFLLFFLQSCSNKNLNYNHQNRTFKKVDTKDFDQEDLYIMYALEYEEEDEYEEAKELYLKLFENTNNYEYFLKYLILSFYVEEYENIEVVVKKNGLDTISNIKQEEAILRIYIFSLIKLEKYEEALKNAKDLLKNNPTDINYELLGNVYLELDKNKEAYASFDKAYNMNHSKNILITLANLKYYKLERQKEAKKLLEEYIDESGYDYNISLQLLSFYENDGEYKKLVLLLKKMYYKYKLGEDATLYEKTKILLIKALLEDEPQKAIEFLEQNNEYSDVLLDLYRTTKQNKKAYLLLKKLYEKTKDPEYLAQEAILEFEIAEDKHSVLHIVIPKFEKALETVQKSLYQNYLAYILIDYERDVSRGIILVEEALKTDSENIAYLDTLAWGEYKNKNCNKAYKVMKKVVDKIGLKDDEIKLHWEQIKKCKK